MDEVNLSEPYVEFGPDVRLIDPPEPTRVQLCGGEQASFRLYRESADFPVVARFTIDGEPTSKARPRTGRNNKYMYTPRETVLAQQKVAEAFLAARQRERSPEMAYGIMAIFFCGARLRRDVDNMMKLIMDGVNGIAWEDDSQVAEIGARKTLTVPGNARSEIVIYQIGRLQRFTADCAGCGKRFTVRQRVQSNGKRQSFCGAECWYEWKRQQNTRTCLSCGREFQAAKVRSEKYCGPACSPKKPRVELSCESCGKSFTKQSCRLRPHNYCSAQCRIDASRQVIADDS